MHHTTITSQQCAELDIMYYEIELACKPTIKARAYRLTHTRTNTTHNDPLTTAHEKYTQALTDYRQIHKIAHKYGYDSATTLAPHIDQLNLEDLTYLTATYLEWARLLRLTPQPTQHLCPSCQQTNLHYRDQDQRYICYACEGAWTPPQLRNAQRHIIATAGQWLTPEETCQKYGLTPTNLRVLKHRHTLTPNELGLYYEPQILHHLNHTRHAH